MTTDSRLRRVLRDEHGMTLIELMISIAILGVIIVPITTSMLFGLIHSSGTRDRIADSSSAQLVTAYFPADVESAGSESIGTGVAFTGNGSCPATAAGETVVLRLTLSNPEFPTVSARRTTVLYVARTAGTSGYLELYRESCTTTPSSYRETLLVQHLVPTGGFVAACVPDTTTCTQVKATIKTFNPNSESESYDGATFEITGTRRTAS